MKSGIYSITAPSGSRYIGSAIDLTARWRTHRYEMRNGRHFNKGLQRACAKYGLENLIFRVLILCLPHDLLCYEQLCLDGLKPKYNACPTAGSQLGRPHTPQTRAQISVNRTGKGLHSDEWKAMMSGRMKGKPHPNPKPLTPEQRRNLSKSMKGKPRGGFEHHVTGVEKAEIVSDYLSGIGQVALEKKWRTTHRVIRRILIAGGVKISKSGHSIKRASKIGAQALVIARAA